MNYDVISTNKILRIRLRANLFPGSGRTVPRRDFWPHSGQPRAKPRILGGPQKLLRPGSPETPFLALSDKYFCQKWLGKLIVISRLFSRLYLPLVRKAWEVTKRKRPCTNAIQPQTFGNGFLFAVFLVQTLTLTQIQVKYFVSLFIWRK